MPKMKIIKPKATAKVAVNPKLKVAKQKWQQAEKKVAATVKKGKQQLKTIKAALDARIQKQQAKVDTLLKIFEQLQKPAIDSVKNVLVKGKKTLAKKMTMKKAAAPKMAKSTKAIKHGKKVGRKKASAKKVAA